MSEGFNITNIGLVLVFLTVVLTALPASPFTMFIQTLDASKFTQYLAWAFPVAQALAILQAWLIAITAFYVISLLARWVKLID